MSLRQPAEEPKVTPRANKVESPVHSSKGPATPEGSKQNKGTPRGGGAVQEVDGGNEDDDDDEWDSEEEDIEEESEWERERATSRQSKRRVCYIYMPHIQC